MLVAHLPKRRPSQLTFISREEFLAAARESARVRHAPQPADLEEFLEILAAETPALPLSTRQIHTVFKAAMELHLKEKPGNTHLNPIRIDARAALMSLDVSKAHKARISQTNPGNVVTLFPGK